MTIAVESGKYILNTKVTKRASSVRKQMAVTLRRISVNKLRRHRRVAALQAAALKRLPEVQVASHPSPIYPPAVPFHPSQIEPETIKARTNIHATWPPCLLGDHIPDEGKRLDSRVIRSLTDSYDVEEEDEEAPQMTPRFRAGVVLKRLVKPEVFEELADMLSRFSISGEDIGSAQEETAVKPNEINGMVVANNNRDNTVPVIRSGGTPRILRARREVGHRVAKPRPQGLERSHTDMVRRLRIQARERSTSSSQILVAGIEADGGMMGLESDEQAEEQHEGGALTTVQTDQHTVADSAVETGEGMVGLEVEEQAIDRLESVKAMGVSPSEQIVTSGAEVGEPVDEVNEVMIGSDVDGVIEVDEETPNPDGDSGSVHGDSMKLEEDGPRVEPNEAGTSDPMRLEQDGPAKANEDGNPESMKLEEDGPQVEANETGNPEPMNIEPHSDRGKVNKEKLFDKMRRERKEIALRQTSASAGSSGGMILDSNGDSTQLGQQHAAPVPVSETGDASASTLNGAEQNLESSDRAEDLRKARLGKRPESRAAPEQVAGSSMTGDGDASNTTSPSKTPNSTPPTSTSSTAPNSPPPRNMPSTHAKSPKRAGAKGEGNVPRRDKRKRGGDSSDEKEASEESEKARVNQDNQSVPGPASQKVPLARRMFRAKSVKREVQTVPDSESSNCSQPEKTYPAESSKRVQQKRPDKGESDEGIICLNDIPDKTLTRKDIQITVALERDANRDNYREGN